MGSMRACCLLALGVLALLLEAASGSLDAQACAALGFSSPGCDACRSLAEYVKDEGVCVCV